MTKAYPDSPEYLARQAKRQIALVTARERLTWTDAEFLAERDAAYVAQQRGYAQPQVETIERDMREDTDEEGYIRFYGTDEG